MRPERSFGPAHRVLTSTTATEEQRAAARADLGTRRLTPAELRDPHVRAAPVHRPQPSLLISAMTGVMIVAAVAVLLWAGYEIGAAIMRLWTENAQLRALALEMRAM